jgi:hypothetical protein
LKTDGSKNGSMAKQMDPLGIMKNGMDEEGWKRMDPKRINGKTDGSVS